VKKRKKAISKKSSKLNKVVGTKNREADGCGKGREQELISTCINGQRTEVSGRRANDGGKRKKGPKTRKKKGRIERQLSYSE